MPASLPARISQPGATVTRAATRVLLVDLDGGNEPEYFDGPGPAWRRTRNGDGMGSGMPDRAVLMHLRD